MNRQARGVEEIRRLSPRDFELLIADIWQECQDWDTEVSDKGADMGVDIIGRPPQGNAVTAVQAKRYSEQNKVTSSQIQQYASIPHQFEEVTSITVVTTSSFTAQAETTAQQLNVKCLDGEDLLRLIDRYNAHEIVDWYCSGKPMGGN